MSIIMEASKLLEYHYEPYAFMAFVYWMQAHDGAKCFETASKGLRVGSFGDANTVLTFKKPMYDLYLYKCTCGYNAMEYDGTVEACRFLIDNLSDTSSKVTNSIRGMEDWAHSHVSIAVDTLTKLQELGIF